MLFDLPLVLWAPLLMTLANLLVFRSLKKGATPANPPKVSVLVPARNEAHNIGGCVSSLLSQDYPNLELIVLDDHSADGTGEIVHDLIARTKSGVNARVINGAALEEGWTGKNWACHQLAQHARGDFFLFVDADTTHAPGAVTAALCLAQSTRAGLLTAWPRPVTRTLGEKLIIPAIYLIGFVFCAHWLVVLLQRFPQAARIFGTRFTRCLGAANGQFLFFSRACYQTIGGHSSVRDNIAEDVVLGREVTARMGAGMRLCNCDALQFSQVRMYRSFRETWEGFSKNLRSIFGRQKWAFWLFLLALWACFLAPTIKWAWKPGALQQALVVLGIRTIVTLRFRTSWASVVLHPIAIILLMAVSLRSWWLSSKRRVEWKGRLYRVET